MGKAIAMTAKEISAQSVELGDAPPAGDAIHHARADEVRPTASEAAGHADYADGLAHFLPLAFGYAHSIGEVEAIRFGSQIDPSDPLAIARPLPPARPAGPETTGLLQP